MKKSKYGYAGLKVMLLLMCVPMGLWAQLRVTLVDAQRHPVVDATVVLLRADSTCAGAALSAPDGSFAFSEVPTHGWLIIQHLQYQTLQLPTDVAVPDTLQLELKGRSLDEVVVKAERPLVQVADGKLCYRLPSLVERQAVSNVYEALAKVPGVAGRFRSALAGWGRQPDPHARRQAYHHECRAVADAATEHVRESGGARGGDVQRTARAARARRRAQCGDQTSAAAVLSGRSGRGLYESVF